MSQNPDVRTRAGRALLRLEQHRWNNNTMSHAIDGLDIAGEMAEFLEVRYPIDSPVSKWRAWEKEEPCLRGTSAPHAEIEIALAMLKQRDRGTQMVMVL